MKKLIIVLLLTLPLFYAAADGWKNQNINGYDFSWRFIDENIEVELSYPTKGWISVGFDAENKMAGANIIIGTVKDGELLIEDHFGNGMFKHAEDLKLDGNDDITEATGLESLDTTILKFTIPADSGDKNDKALEEGGTYRIIFASSKSDDIGKKHSKRAGADIKL
ncbi:MAG: hypothetical protein JEZ04_09900 [Spirochaetales bacterium]|nr:hypothetical protein [Spirochaetales bacterium]